MTSRQDHPALSNMIVWMYTLYQGQPAIAAPDATLKDDFAVTVDANDKQAS